MGTWTTPTCDQGTCTASVSGLTDDVSYTCYLIAVDANGCERGCGPGGSDDLPCGGAPGTPSLSLT